MVIKHGAEECSSKSVTTEQRTRSSYIAGLFKWVTVFQVIGKSKPYGSGARSKTQWTRMRGHINLTKLRKPLIVWNSSYFKSVLCFQGYVAIILMLMLQSIVVLHQRQHRHENNLEKIKDSIVFPSIKRENADEGLFSAFKFFANYCFYKFGLEVSVWWCGM